VTRRADKISQATSGQQGCHFCFLAEGVAGRGDDERRALCKENFVCRRQIIVLICCRKALRRSQRKAIWETPVKWSLVKQKIYNSGMKTQTDSKRRQVRLLWVSIVTLAVLGTGFIWLPGMERSNPPYFLPEKLLGFGYGFISFAVLPILIVLSCSEVLAVMVGRRHSEKPVSLLFPFLSLVANVISAAVVAALVLLA